MGEGNFNPQEYKRTAEVASRQEIAQTFPSSNMVDNLNPIRMRTPDDQRLRESCISGSRNNLLPVIIGFDVTGSMGEIPHRLIQGPLGAIFGKLGEHPQIDNVQLMFAGVGDSKTDKAPIQVTQFESSNVIYDQLTQIYLERGGGGNGGESYHLLWYIAAFHTRLESFEKNGQKGVIFTMGDDGCHGVLTRDEILKYVNPDYEGGDIKNADILQELRKRYHVFHIDLPFSGSHASNTQKARERGTHLSNFLNEDELLTADGVEDISDLIIKHAASCVNQAKAVAAPAAPSGAAEADRPPAYDFKAEGKLTAASQSGLSALDQQVVGKIGAHCICPLTQKVFVDPVILSVNGKTYEKSEVDRKLREVSPVIEGVELKQVDGTYYTENTALKGAIDRAIQDIRNAASASVITRRDGSQIFTDGSSQPAQPPTPQRRNNSCMLQ